MKSILKTIAGQDKSVPKTGGSVTKADDSVTKIGGSVTKTPKSVTKPPETNTFITKVDKSVAKAVEAITKLDKAFKSKKTPSTSAPVIELDISDDLVTFSELSKKQILGELPCAPKYEPALGTDEIVRENLLKYKAGYIKAEEPKYPECPTPTNMATFAHKAYMYEALEGAIHGA